MRWLRRLDGWARSDASDTAVLWAGTAMVLLCAGAAAGFIFLGWWLAAAGTLAAMIVVGYDTARLARALRAESRHPVDRE